MDIVKDLARAYLKPMPVSEIELHQMRRYLEQHGVEARVADGKLIATDEASLNGELVSQTVELEPSMAAVRAFLGY